MNIPSWIKPGIWGAVLGAVAWWGVLSWGFGWMSYFTYPVHKLPAQIGRLNHKWEYLYYVITNLAMQ